MYYKRFCKIPRTKKATVLSELQYAKMNGRMSIATVTHVPTALTLCLATPSRKNTFHHSFALALDSETQKDNERLTINRESQRRLQDSATVFIYNQI